MYNRYVWTRLTNTITAALTALTNAQRSVRDIGDVVGTTNSLTINLATGTPQYLEMRFYGTATDADSNVVEIYAARGTNDDYTHVGQLTLTTGTMVRQGGTDLYADTMSWSSTDDAFNLVRMNSGNNDVAKAWINTNGYNKLLMVASTLNSTNIVCEAAFSDQEEMPGTAVAIDLINTNLEASLIDNSASGGTQKLTIASNVVSGADQACTSALVTWDGTGPIYVNEGATADVNDFRLPTESAGVGQPLSFPVRNTNQLRFYSGTDGDFVRIFWRA